MDRRFLAKCALYGALAQLILIPLLLIVFNALPKPDVEDSLNQGRGPTALAAEEPLPPAIHTPDGDWDANSVWVACRGALAPGPAEQPITSFRLVGQIKMNNGIHFEQSLMGRPGGLMRERLQSGDTVKKRISDGTFVWHQQAMATSQEYLSDGPCGQNPWWASRLTASLPLLLTSDQIHFTEMRESPEGFRCRLSWPESVPVWVVLDPETGLLRRAEVLDAAGDHIVGATYGDYRDVSGLRLPHQINLTMAGRLYEQDMRVEQYQLNLGLARSLFSP